MENAAEIYTVASLSKNELIESKIGLLADLIVTINRLSNTFSNNRYLGDAISYIYDYYQNFFVELDREHDIYDSIMDYLSYFENISDADDIDFCDELAGVFDELEECFLGRVSFYSFFCENIENIFENNVLTNSNYLFANFPEYLSEEKAEYMKSLIPG